MDWVPDGIAKNLSEPPAGSAYKGSGERAVNKLDAPVKDYKQEMVMTEPLKVQSPDNFRNWKC